MPETIRGLFVVQRQERLFDLLCEIGKDPSVLFAPIPPEAAERLPRSDHPVMHCRQTVMLSPIGFRLAMIFDMWLRNSYEAQDAMGVKRGLTADETGLAGITHSPVTRWAE